MENTLPGPKIYLLSWLVPGLGYYLNGLRMKAMLIFVLITGTFIGGLLMGGGIFSQSGDFISRVCMASRLGAGLPWLIGLAPGLRYTELLSNLGEIGSCFTAVSGLLNVLAAVSVGDIRKGK